jgi:hypothetical protein
LKIPEIPSVCTWGNLSFELRCFVANAISEELCHRSMVGLPQDRDYLFFGETALRYRLPF